VLAILDTGPALTVPTRAGQTVIDDCNYDGRGFEAELDLAHAGRHLLRSARKGE
jgi:hypothetical protein